MENFIEEEFESIMMLLRMTSYFDLGNIAMQYMFVISYHPLRVPPNVHT